MDSEKINYKDTLCLPRTGFSMKANLPHNEPFLLAYWQEIDLYHHIQHMRQDRDVFILHDGPPYANGNIHIGHAVNKILKDMILKSKLMQGMNIDYRPGWDCHGLPIEHQVEKKYGNKLDHAAFRKKCREYAEQQISNQKKDFMRLGILGDWQNCYKTMDTKTEANIVRSLGKIVKKGHVSYGVKPVLWSVVGRSALAEAEVEYIDKKSTAIYVTYVVSEGEFKDTSILIWTTTPWTLPASLAVSVGKDIEYVVCRSDKGKIICAKSLCDDIADKTGIILTIERSIQGKELEHFQLVHPLFSQKRVPIILADHVDTEIGTGCVHTAPDHGVEDFYACAPYNIDPINSLDDAGYYQEHIEYFAGKHIYKSDDIIVQHLKERSTHFYDYQFTHSYPHCWRSKTPLIYRATAQWFISMTTGNLKEKCLEAIKRVEWLPGWGYSRIQGMIESSPDWCISRQRRWGVPITFFVDKETHELHPKTEIIIQDIANSIEEHGIEYWFQLEAKTVLGDDADQYRKITDTLDVWFDSGVTHDAILNLSKNQRVDLYLEGSDQHRGWFQSSLKTSIAMREEEPYKTVLTHGFTVDQAGKKMSKSLGNVVSVDHVLKTRGADILRLWVASNDFSSEMSISDEILDRVGDSYRRLRNTIRYFLSNLDGFDVDSDAVSRADMLEIDKWAIDITDKLFDKVRHYYASYQFHLVYQEILNFCIHDMGSQYLSLIKDRMYTCHANSVMRRSAQTALYLINTVLLQMLAPILSFTTEEAWKSLNHKDSIFITQWNKDMLTSLTEKDLMSSDDWKALLAMRSRVQQEFENIKKEGNISDLLQTAVSITDTEENIHILKKLGDEASFFMGSSALECHAGKSCYINIEEAKGYKCVRCWHCVTDVGDNADHPDICKRCIDSVQGASKRHTYV